MIPAHPQSDRITGTSDSSREVGAIRFADVELVAQALDGHPQSVDKLLERLLCIPKFLGSLSRQSRISLGDEEAAEYAQHVLVKAWSSLRRYKGLASIETWTYAVCRNAMSGFARDRLRTNLNMTEISDALVGSSELVRMCSGRGGRAESRAIQRALQSLPEPVAQVIRLRHQDDLGIRVISEQSGVPLGTVKDRYYRGISKLREQLRAESSA